MATKADDGTGRSTIGAIVGGVFGFILLVVVVAIGVSWLLHRRREEGKDVTLQTSEHATNDEKIYGQTSLAEKL